MVRVRIAPSPTGYPHLGLIYQAIFDWVFAKKFKGKFVLRIEDTDRNRFVKGSEDVIYDGLKWANLLPDEGPREGGEYGPYRQSERLEHYQKYANQLLESGNAYRCFCTRERLDQMRKDQEVMHQPPMYDRTCLNLTKEEIDQKLAAKELFVIRMKIPKDRKIKVKDAIVGEVEFDSNQIDDQVILKSDGFPTYHLAVVVDDYLMKISHVFRGTEWMPSTPKHVLLWEFLNWIEDMPAFIHVPVILNSEGGGKLSKRHAHTSINFYKQEGFLPEAVVNYLANIVWNHPEEKEIFQISDFGQAFELDPLILDIKSNGVRFDLKKLEWVNALYIRSLSDEDLTKRLQEFLVEHPSKEKIAPVVPLIKERIKKLSDFVPLTDFLWEKPEYDLGIFDRLKIKDLRLVIKKVLEELEKMEKPWSSEAFESTFRKLAEDLGIPVSSMFQLIRVAVSGQLVTPPLFESIEILGMEESFERVRESIRFLE